MNQGSALLLKEIIFKSLHSIEESSNNEAVYRASNSLKEFGISQLSSEDAEYVLSLRVDL